VLDQLGVAKTGRGVALAQFDVMDGGNGVHTEDL
jgi:hypothetical protein